MAGLLGSQMPEEQPTDELQASPATFMTLQVLKHLFEPETAQQWVQAAMQGNPAEVVAMLANDAVASSMDAAQGRASEQDAQAALGEIITSLVLFMVSAEVVPQEAADQLAQEAMQMAAQPMQQQQPEQGGMMPPQGGQPMPPQGGMMPQQPGGPMQ